MSPKPTDELLSHDVIAREIYVRDAIDAESLVTWETLPAATQDEYRRYHHNLRREFLAKLSKELSRAYSKHGAAPWGRHEFYAILKEEVDELWDAIKGDETDDRVHDELIQVAAMCLRYYETGARK